MDEHKTKSRSQHRHRLVFGPRDRRDRGVVQRSATAAANAIARCHGDAIETPANPFINFPFFADLHGYQRRYWYGDDPANINIDPVNALRYRCRYSCDANGHLKIHDFTLIPNTRHR